MNGNSCDCGVMHAWQCTLATCQRDRAPELSETEAAIVAHFEAGEAAPESYVQQHTFNDGTCFCEPYQVGTLGVWTHRVVEP